MGQVGGVADKYGNRFEGRWTVHCLCDLLLGRAERIDLEPPGSAGEGVEFILWRERAAEHHQIKSGRASGTWTITKLAREGVLGHFQRKLRDDPGCACVLVVEAAADQLHGLVEAANRAASVDDFEERLSDSLGRAWQTLLTEWAAPDTGEALEWLSRIQVQQWSDQGLQIHLKTELEALITGRAEVSEAVLARYALERLSGGLIGTDVWAHLEENGLRPTQWSQDKSIPQAVVGARERFLAAHKAEEILGRPIPRGEAATVARALTQDEPAVVFVVGDGGMGKSALAVQVIRELDAQGVPVLPFRVDLLQPVVQPREVGEQLGLPGPPAPVLAAVAGGRRAVLCVDQLDAISLTSGRTPEFWNCLQEVIDQALLSSGVSVLVICRRFDLDNDDRFRRFAEDRAQGGSIVDVGPLSVETVEGVLSSLGLDPSDLAEEQRELLAVPLHLRLLSLVVAESDKADLSFRNPEDLFERYWTHKSLRLDQRIAPREFRWATTLNAITESMSRMESLSLPRTSLDEMSREVALLLSEHVLVQQDDRIAFFHQRFFDYVFARAFTSKGEDLRGYLLSTEQGLFRREQVRQVLAHLRESDPPRYRQSLESTLADPLVRFHLKRTALDFLAGISVPTHDEWEIVKGLLQSGLDERHHSLDLLGGHAAWFDLALEDGTIGGWLASHDGSERDEAVALLRRIQRQRPGHVAKLLSSYINQSADWNDRLRWIAQWGDLSVDRAYFEFFIDLLRAGVLDEARGPIAINSDFWSLAYGLEKAEPVWACELIGAYLDRRLLLAQDEGISDPFAPGATIPDTQDPTFIVQAARVAPAPFVSHVLPFMLEVIQANINQDRTDTIWFFRYPDVGRSTKAAILIGMEHAMNGLAASNAVEFQEIARNLGSRGSETLDFLLMRAYRNAPNSLANEAVEFILAVPDRLNIGYASQGAWVSREFVQWAADRCSAESRVRLIDAILAYYPPWERSARGRGQRGHCQYVNLSGLATAHLADQVRKRLQELERRFGSEPRPPSVPEAMVVPPPIPDERAEHMNDDQWLRAMAKYSEDWEGPGSVLGGGAVQLSRVLGKAVGLEPERFVALMEAAPDTLNSHYFGAVVGAVAETSESNESLVRQACSRAHRLAGQPCGLAIARAAEGFARKAALPAEILEMVCYYGVEDADPATEPGTLTDVSQRPDLYTAGINSTRGASAEAIAGYLFGRGASAEPVMATLRHMAEDPSLSVRSCVANSLVALINHDREEAVRLFISLVQTGDELLETRHVQRFIYFTTLSHPTQIRPIIERMVVSALDGVREAGSRQACIASLELESFADLRLTCLTGDEQLRAGAATAFAANLTGAAYRSDCEAALIGLFSDSAPSIAKNASECFDVMSGVELADYTSLAAAFVDSPAFDGGYFSLLRALETSEVALPNLTLRFASRFLEMAGGAMADFSSRMSADSMDVAPLVLRAYAQAADQDQRDRALDVIDRMSAVRAYGLDQSLHAYERR